MNIRLLLVLLTFSAFATSAEEAPEATIQGSYFAIIVSDVEASRNWYQTVLGLQELSRSTQIDRYDIINMAGPGLFVELLQLPAASERPGGQIEGPFKIGMLVDDLTNFAATLPTTVGDPKIVYDDKNRVLVLQIRDPDNNTIQVMQYTQE